MGNVNRPVLLFVKAILNAQIAKGDDGIGRILLIVLAYLLHKKQFTLYILS